MSINSKGFAWLILGITAIVSSRGLFYFFNDSEGPNLLIVGVLAGVVYGVALVAYRSAPSNLSYIRLLIAILVQLLIVAGLYLLLA